MQKLYFMVLLVLFLVSCEANQMQTPTLKTNTPTPTIMMLDMPTVFSTPNPTSTNKPTQTIDPIQATQEVALASCRGNSDTPIDKYIQQAYSQFNHWTATVCQDDGIYTKVLNLETEKIWNVASIDDNTSYSGPEWFWEPFLWSENSKYLYMKSEPIGFIDSPWLRYSSGFGLSRLNLENGQMDVWLKPSQGGYHFAFNSDATFFISSFTGFPNILKIRDLNLGKEENLILKDKYYALSFAITPNDSRLVVMAQEYEATESKDNIVLFIYNMKTKTLRKIFVSSNQVDANIIFNQISNDYFIMYDIYTGDYIQANILTGDVSILRELPAPISTP